MNLNSIQVGLLISIAIIILLLLDTYRRSKRKKHIKAIALLKEQQQIDLEIEKKIQIEERKQQIKENQKRLENALIPKGFVGLNEGFAVLYLSSKQGEQKFNGSDINRIFSQNDLILDVNTGAFNCMQDDQVLYSILLTGVPSPIDVNHLYNLHVTELTAIFNLKKFVDLEYDTSEYLDFFFSRFT